MLETLDNLERAIPNLCEADREGVRKIADGLLIRMEKFGLITVDPEGEPFDPNFHEALLTEEVEGVEEDTVIEVLSKGYTIEGKLVRPAKVKVSK